MEKVNRKKCVFFSTFMWTVFMYIVMFLPKLIGMKNMDLSFSMKLFIIFVSIVLCGASGGAFCFLFNFFIDKCIKRKDRD